MKVLRCSKCNKNQQQGKFCLDCGGLLTEIVNSNIEFKAIKSSRGSDRLKRDIRSWLIRIGVQQPDIKISSSGSDAVVEYILNKNLYSFSSSMQDNFTNNLAAVEQFLHMRVLSIERGIETIEKAFAGYEAIPDFTDGNNFDPYNALGFQSAVPIEEARLKFRILVKKYHPDVNSSTFAATQFQRLKKAIDELENRERPHDETNNG